METREPASERWLITGGCGQLGAHLMRQLHHCLPDQATVIGLARHPCAGHHGEVLVADLEHPGVVDELLSRTRPTHIVHLAGVSSPASAETEPDRCWHLHHTLTQQLATYARATEAWMFFASTDFVWDGSAEGRRSEAERPLPLGEYGRSKLAGEGAVLAEGGSAGRFSLLYGLPICPRDTTWVRLVAALEAGLEVPAFVGEYRTPLPLADAAAMIARLGEIRHRGLINIAGPDVLTPKDLFERIAADLGLPARLRATIREPSSGSPRPRNAALDDTALRSLMPDLAARGSAMGLLR